MSDVLKSPTTREKQLWNLLNNEWKSVLEKEEAQLLLWLPHPGGTPAAKGYACSTCEICVDNGGDNVYTSSSNKEALCYNTK